MDEETIQRVNSPFLQHYIDNGHQVDSSTSFKAILVVPKFYSNRSRRRFTCHVFKSILIRLLKPVLSKQTISSDPYCCHDNNRCYPIHIFTGCLLSIFLQTFTLPLPCSSYFFSVCVTVYKNTYFQHVFKILEFLLNIYLFSTDYHGISVLCYSAPYVQMSEVIMLEGLFNIDLCKLYTRTKHLTSDGGETLLI